MAVLITHIARNIDKSDSILDAVIQDYFNSRAYNEPVMTISEWRVKHYKELRRWAYPDKTEYYDAQVKLNSDIPEMETEGLNQINDYIQACLDVKARFPKE